MVSILFTFFFRYTRNSFFNSRVKFPLFSNSSNPFDADVSFIMMMRLDFRHQNCCLFLTFLSVELLLCFFNWTRYFHSSAIWISNCFHCCRRADSVWCRNFLLRLLFYFPIKLFTASEITVFQIPARFTIENERNSREIISRLTRSSSSCRLKMSEHSKLLSICRVGIEAEERKRASEAKITSSGYRASSQRDDNKSFFFFPSFRFYILSSSHQQSEIVWDSFFVVVCCCCRIPFHAHVFLLSWMNAMR